MALSVTGFLYSAFLFIQNKHKQLKEKRIVYFIFLMGLLQFLSMIANLYGSINLSKTLLVAGYSGAVLGISLLWIIRLINQMLALSSQIYQKHDKKLFFINFDKIVEKGPGIFYLFLIICWIWIIGRNFYGFNTIYGTLINFLNKERMLGSYAFSINGLVIFLLILVVSLMLSRLISFFTADPDAIPANKDKRHNTSVGSWLLLVRIFIISAGLFLAVAASGVPLDRVTIILGALSVGIGLGLQGLFNNLVSGIIIAFENPVKVGDWIEIDEKPGLMMSIGFRSSVINLHEGASIIIPNGDLLSQKLVNWTMGKGKKVTIKVGVAYGTDLKKAIKLIKVILDNDKRILSHPASRVLPVEFAESSIDLEVAFWIHHFLELPFVKGDIIMEIDLNFKKEGIVIAFPQRDLHIRSETDNPEIKYAGSNENPQLLM